MVLGTEVGLSPCDFVLVGVPARSSKRGLSSLPIFGPRLLWPNGWMDQDATCYGGRPRPTRHCVRWEPSSPFPKGAQPEPPTQFSANVRCGRTAGWTKMVLDMAVGLGPGDFVFDREPAAATFRKEGTSTFTHFWPVSVVAKRLDG